VREIFADLDPVRLLRDIRAAQQRLVALADATNPPVASEETNAPPLEAFLSSLRTAWQSGEPRPTASDKPKVRRGRRRPDPLIDVTEQLKRWFEEEPWRTGRELLEKLQTELPGDYPDGLLRTVQRRLKIWRSEQACALVFSNTSVAPYEGVSTTRDCPGCATPASSAGAIANRRAMPMDGPLLDATPQEFVDG